MKAIPDVSTWVQFHVMLGLYTTPTRVRGMRESWRYAPNAAEALRMACADRILGDKHWTTYVDAGDYSVEATGAVW